MHVGSIQFRLLGFLAVGTICSFIACSGGGSSPSTVTPTPPPVVSVVTPTITAPAEVVAGTPQVSASVVEPQSDASYTWSIEGGTIIGSASGTSVQFAADQPGTLTLSVTASIGTESRRGTTHVTVQGTLPAKPVLDVATSVSTGASIQANVVTPQGSTTYTWSIIDGTITTSPTATWVTFTAGNAGTLTLTCKATNTVGSVSTSALITVVPLAPTKPVITAPTSVTAATTNNAATVDAQSGCTYLWNLTGGTISGGQGTTALTFTAGAAGTTMVLSCNVINSAQVSNSSQVNITVVAPPAPAPPPPSPTPTPTPTVGYYGSCVNADDIANIVIGYNTANDTCNRVASYRLKATHSGTLASIRPFFIWSSTKPGYNLGDGGIIQIQLQTDDGTTNHFPSGKALATIIYNNPVPPYNTDHWPLLSFPTPPTLTAGTIYHLVFSNISPDPKANWVSLDCLWQWKAYSQNQPTVSDTDMNILEMDPTGKWVIYTRGAGTVITPVIELDYSDGASQGQGYIQGFASPDSSFVNPKPISGAQQVRQIFTVTGSTRTVNAVSVRVNRLSGSSPLTVTVEKADGTVVGQGTATVTMNPQATYTYNGETWNKVTFASPITLSAGVAYHLVLSCPADTVHTTHILAKGATYGYKGTTCFGDGHAEFNPGTGWVGWDFWGIKNRTDCDLQFFFVTQ